MPQLKAQMMMTKEEETQLSQMNLRESTTHEEIVTFINKLIQSAFLAGASKKSGIIWKNIK